MNLPLGYASFIHATKERHPDKRIVINMSKNYSLQLKTDDGLYINLHEAALVDSTRRVTHQHLGGGGQVGHEGVEETEAVRMLSFLYPHRVGAQCARDGREHGNEYFQDFVPKIFLVCVHCVCFNLVNTFKA